MEEALTDAKYNELVRGLTRQGVSLTDANGEFRSTYDIIKDIAEIWPTLSSMEQSGLATTLAGTRQQAIFFSLVEQFREATGAMDAMNDSAGQLETTYGYYMDSTSAHINQLKVAMESLGETTFDTGFLNFFVDIGTMLANWANGAMTAMNAIGGLRTALIALVAVLAIVKADNIGMFFMELGSAVLSTAKAMATYVTFLPQVFGAYKSIITGSATLTAGLSDLGAAASTAGLSLSGIQAALIPIVAVVAAAVTAFVAYNAQVEKMREETRQNALEAKNQTDALNDLIKTYKQLGADGIQGDELEQILQLQTDICNSVQTQVENIDLANGKYEEQLLLLHKIAAANAEENKDEFKEEYEATKSDVEKGVKEVRNGFVNGLLQNLIAGILREGGDNYNQFLADSVKNLVGEDGVYDFLYKFDNSSLEEQLKLVESLHTLLLENTNVAPIASEYNINIDPILDKLGDASTKLKEFIRQENEAADNYFENESVRNIDSEINKALGKDTVDNLDEYITVLDQLNSEGFESREIDKYRESLASIYPELARSIEVAEDGTISFVKLKSSLANVDEAIESTGDIISVLNTAYTEMGSALGGLSPDTIKALAKADEDFIKYLEVENGQLKLNTEALNEYARSKMQSKIEANQADLDTTYEQLAEMEREHAGITEAMNEYLNIEAEMKQNGISPNQTKLGNVEMEFRPKIEWDEATFDKYKDILATWFSNELSGEELEQTLRDEFLGTVSTVWGGFDEFGDVQIPIAYTPFINEAGNLVPLTSDSVYDYLEKIANDSIVDGKVDLSRLLELDENGITTKVNGVVRHISNIIMGAGEDAEKNSIAGHYVGQFGALELAKQGIIQTGINPEGLDVAIGKFESLNEQAENFQSIGAVLNEMYSDLMSTSIGESPVGIVKPLGNLEDQIASISEAMRDFEDDGTVSFKSMSELFDDFGHLDSFENFISVLSNGKSTMEQVQAASNALATEYFNQIGILNQLTEENKEVAVLALQRVGVVNAEAVVEQQLAAIKYEHMLAEEGLANAVWESNDSLVQSATAKLKDAGASETVINAIKKMRLEEVKAKLATIDLANSNASLSNSFIVTAKAAGVSEKAMQMIESINTFRQAYQDKTLVPSDMDNYADIMAKKQANLSAEIQKEIDELMNGEIVLPEFNVPKELNDTSSNSSDSKNKVDEYIADIEKFRREIDNLEKTQNKLERLDIFLEGDQDYDKQLAYQRQRIDLLTKEQEQMHTLAEARRAYITEQVGKLRQQGFEIEWDPEQNHFLVVNLEHINELLATTAGKYDSVDEATNELRKDAEKMIKDLEEYNDADIELSNDWYTAQYDRLDAKIAIYESMIQREQGVQTLLQHQLDQMTKTMYQDTHLSPNELSWEALAHAVGLTTDELKQYNQEMSGLSSGALSALTTRGTENYAAALSSFDDLKAKAEDMGIDLGRTLYGNIDLANRQVINWTRANLDSFKDELASWTPNPDDLFGKTSDALSSSVEIGGKTFAFTPTLQTEDGPVLLSRATLYKYIAKLVQELDASGVEWTDKDLLQLDIDGLFVDGRLIHGLLADIGQDANKTAQALALIGQGGEFDHAVKMIESFRGSAQITAADVEELRHTNEDLNAAMEANGWSAEEVAEKFNAYAASLTVASNRTGLAIDDMTSLQAAMGNNADLNAFDVLNAYVARSQKIIDTQKQMQEMYHQEAELLRENGETTSQRLDELSDNWYQAQDTIKEIQDQMYEDIKSWAEQTNEQLSSLDSVYQTLHDAADEYASNGGFISIGTYQSILSMEPQYLRFLQDENGMLRINEQAIQDMIRAKTEQLALDTAISYVEQLRAAQQNNDIEKLKELTLGTYDATNATWDLVYAQTAQLGLSSDMYKGAVEVIRNLQSLPNIVMGGIGNFSRSYSDELNDMKSGIDDIISYVQDMLTNRVEHLKDALEKLSEHYERLISLKKKSLDQDKEQASYADKLEEKVREMAKLQERLSGLSLDDSRDAAAQRKQLNEDMYKLQKEIEEEQRNHAIDTQKDSLDTQLDEYQREKKLEEEALDELLSSQTKKYEAAIEYIKTHWDTLYKELINWNYECGSTRPLCIVICTANCTYMLEVPKALLHLMMARKQKQRRDGRKVKS